MGECGYVLWGARAPARETPPGCPIRCSPAPRSVWDAGVRERAGLCHGFAHTRETRFEELGFELATIWSCPRYT